MRRLFVRKAEFTELDYFPTSVGQPLIIHFYTYTYTTLLLLYSVRTIQVIHAHASTTVLDSCLNVECTVCGCMSPITITITILLLLRLYCNLRINLYYCMYKTFHVNVKKVFLMHVYVY